MTKFPSTKDIAWELRALNSNAEGRTTVYLQVFDDGKWWVHIAGASVDSTEHCYFAQAEVPGCIGSHKKPRKFDAEEIARHLIKTVKKQYQDNGNPT